VVLDHVLKDAARRAGRRRRGSGLTEVSLDDLGDATRHDLPSDPSPSPTSDARAAELLALARERLDERAWSVWYAVEVEGMASTDVAEWLDVTPSAVRGILLRARARLKQALARGRTGPPRT